MDIYKVDLAKVKTQTQLHEVLRDNMDFPEFYEKNLDALWDCLIGFIDAPAHTYFYGVTLMSEEIQTYFYTKILDIFKDAKKWYAEFNEEFSVTIVD